MVFEFGFSVMEGSLCAHDKVADFVPRNRRLCRSISPILSGFLPFPTLLWGGDLIHGGGVSNLGLLWLGCSVSIVRPWLHEAFSFLLYWKAGG